MQSDGVPQASMSHLAQSHLDTKIRLTNMSSYGRSVLRLKIHGQASYKK
jgi:hypothetical protein